MRCAGYSRSGRTRTVLNVGHSSEAMRLRPPSSKPKAVTVGELCEQNKISINAVLQNVITDPNDVKFVVTTESCKVSQVRAMCEQFSQLEYSLSDPIFLPFV